MLEADKSVILNNGNAMPTIGLGTWQAAPGEVGQAVEYALLESGYRHIDCAAAYQNQREIGAVFDKIFQGNKVAREEVFVTSKLWNNSHNYGDVEVACKETLKELQLDYLDLYLMHWALAVPPGTGALLDENGFLLRGNIPVRDTWEAMEELMEEGLVRSIGVSNFTGLMLVDLLSYAQIKPAVNQIELHPYNPQERLVKFCQYNDIALTAYSPLGSPGNFPDPAKHPVLLEDQNVRIIAARHDKTPAQVLLRWAIQRKTAAIPKSVTPDNIKSNMDVFDFALTAEEMDVLSSLQIRHRYIDPWTWWKIPYFD